MLTAIANERIAELQAEIAHLRSRRGMEKHLIGFMLQFGYGGQLVLQPDDIAEATKWDYEPADNEAGELVLTTEAVPNRLPPVVTGRDLGKGMSDDGMPLSH